MSIISKIPQVLIKRIETYENLNECANKKPSKKFREDVIDVVRAFKPADAFDHEFMSYVREEVKFLTELRKHATHDTLGDLYNWLKNVELKEK